MIKWFTFTMMNMCPSLIVIFMFVNRISIRMNVWYKWICLDFFGISIIFMNIWHIWSLHITIMNMCPPLIVIFRFVNCISIRMNVWYKWICLDFLECQSSLWICGTYGLYISLHMSEWWILAPTFKYYSFTWFNYQLPFTSSHGF